MKKLILLLVVLFGCSAVIQAADPSPSASPKKGKNKSHVHKPPHNGGKMALPHPPGGKPSATQ
jgi:uncharacterized protein YceK